MSHSCYDPLPDGSHCGLCDAAAASEGLRRDWVVDPTRYAATPTRVMTYAVKECPHPAGRGSAVGQPRRLPRFGRMHLWSGREQDRATAQCNFCDTDFVGTDGRAAAICRRGELTDRIAAIWGDEVGARQVVITGGERCCSSTPSS